MWRPTAAHAIERTRPCSLRSPGTIDGNSPEARRAGRSSDPEHTPQADTCARSLGGCGVHRERDRLWLAATAVAAARSGAVKSRWWFAPSRRKRDLGRSSCSASLFKRRSCSNARPFYRIEILPREFLRQAVLIAARDELGARHARPGDRRYAGRGRRGAIAVAEISSVIRNFRSSAQLRAQGGEASEMLLALQIADGAGQTLDLGKLLARARSVLTRAVPDSLEPPRTRGQSERDQGGGGLFARGRRVSRQPGIC